MKEDLEGLRKKLADCRNAQADIMHKVEYERSRARQAFEQRLAKRLAAEFGPGLKPLFKMEAEIIAGIKALDPPR